MDRNLFKERLGAIAQFYGKSLNAFVIGAYWDRLKDLSDREFEAACKFAINEYEFMPPASKLYEAVRGSNEAQMHCEWAKAIKAASEGLRLAESGLDAMACYAIDKIGGLYLLGSISDRDASWKKKEFAELYREAIAMQATGFLPALPPAATEEIKALPEVSDEEARENVKAIAAMLRDPKGRRRSLEAQFQQGRGECEEVAK